MEGQTVAVGQLHWVQHQARIRSNSSASSSSSSSSSNESDLDSGLSGQSMIYVGLEGKGVVGALGFSDTLRPDSQYVVQQLRSRGIRVVVLSGLVKCKCTLEAPKQVGALLCCVAETVKHRGCCGGREWQPCLSSMCVHGVNIPTSAQQLVNFKACG